MVAKEIFSELKDAVKKDYSSDKTSGLIAELYTESQKYLNANCELKDLVSKVQGKEYLSFVSKDNRLSRPLNKALYVIDENESDKIVDSFMTNTYATLERIELVRLLYTIGMTFPCFIDVTKKGDRKTPGSYFEYFVGHIIAKRFGANPRKQLEIPVASEGPQKLPTDLIFDKPSESYGLHIPIKSTTRERVIQVWAHQRILDGVFGVERYKGILVVGSETKLNSRTKEVEEICLPLQWKIYQLHIAKLTRIYYLDPPAKYVKLNDTFPKIPVNPFADFFIESITSF